MENFITAFSVAQDLEMKTLEENLVQQFQANFMIYVENKHYLNFSFKMMERIFDVYFINALDQEFLSSIILDWIDYDCDSRMSYFKWMIETVNIGDLSTNFILEIGSCYAHLFTCITFSSMYVELLDKYYGPLE
uniref:BACK domain-containing protein n=1 Tax=Rhabditophanes sp. KR3021 TaxID=114890 RepID=A0AC35UH64_9BILA